nr:potassium channel protein [uncultured Holophaga sp.]
MVRESPPLARLRHTLLLLLAVVLAGGVGYHFLAHLNTVDSFYMAITTLFTVGFREMGDVNTLTKLFTIIYLVMGLGTATYAVSNMTALFVEGDIQGYLRERRMERKLAELKDHIILCGFGKMGFQAAWELKQADIPFVVIEQDASKTRNPRFEGEIFLVGNAMDELILIRAGLSRARGLITALASDADNVLVTLTAKQMAPDVEVVARAAKLGTENKLRAAGADHIVSPYEIGGRRMANLFITPDMINFVDVFKDGSEGVELALEHVLVSPSSPLAGQTLRDTRIRDTTGALVVGINRAGDGLRFNPKGAEVFQEGDVLLVLGPHDALESFVTLARGVTVHPRRRA